MGLLSSIAEKCSPANSPLLGARVRNRFSGGALRSSTAEPNPTQSTLTLNPPEIAPFQVSPPCDQCGVRKAVGFVPVCRCDDTGASGAFLTPGSPAVTGLGLGHSPFVEDSGDKFVVYYFCAECRENGTCSQCGQRIFAWESSLRASTPDCMECRCGRKVIPKAHNSSLQMRFESDRPEEVEAAVVVEEEATEEDDTQTEQEYLDAIRKAYQEDVERRDSCTPLSAPENDHDFMIYDSPVEEEDDAEEDLSDEDF